MRPLRGSASLQVMSATFHRSTTIEVLAGAAGERGPAARHLLLRQSDDGWSLLRSDGEVVFRAMGDRGRRRCLEFARAVGVLAVIS
jgi:hypothetical protein